MTPEVFEFGKYMDWDEPQSLPTASRLTAPYLLTGLARQVEEIDLVCRINVSASAAEVRSWPTAHLASLFSQTFGRFEQSLCTLRSVIKWQQHRLDYNSVHTAFLLGAISEEEFEGEAQQYVRESASLPPEEIAEKIADIESALSAQLPPSDYADFLGVEVEEVAAAMPMVNTILAAKIPTAVPLLKF